MRLRSKKIRSNQDEQEFMILEPQAWKGKWNVFFGNDRPIHLECGMGKGQFISTLSVKNRGINFIGMDMYDELIVRANQKVQKLWQDDEGQPTNLAFIRGNAAFLTEMFAKGELERIYLNFSDPWPKTRHRKRRLTHPRFLLQYKHVLSNKGEIHFKTDSCYLFEFSLNTFCLTQFQLRNISLDLHREQLRNDLILTEYETKFVLAGKPIYRLEAIVEDPF